MGRYAAFASVIVLLAAAVGEAWAEGAYVFDYVVIRWPHKCTRVAVGVSDSSSVPLSAGTLPATSREICQLAELERPELEAGEMCDWRVRAQNRSDCEQNVQSFLHDLIRYQKVVSDWIIIDVQLPDGPETAFVSNNIVNVPRDAQRFCSSLMPPLQHEKCVAELQHLAMDMHRGKRPLYTPSKSVLEEPLPASAALPPLVGFWHIAAMSPVDGISNGSQPEPQWLKVVREQHQVLLSSGLPAKARAIHAIVVGETGFDMAGLLSPPSPAVHDEVFKVVRSSEGLSSFEFATLTRLEEYCRQDGHGHHWVWYMHNKGSSRPASQGTIGETLTAWRQLLEYHILERHEDCLAAMAQGYRTCGSLWSPRLQLYAGNFWWARCSHIRELPPVSSLPRHDRHTAEYWVGMRGDGTYAANCYPLLRGGHAMPLIRYGDQETGLHLQPSSYRHDLNASLPSCLDRHQQPAQPA